MVVVRKHISLDEETARLLESYAEQLGLTESALIRVMVRQISVGIQALEKPPKEEKGDAGQSGDV